MLIDIHTHNSKKTKHLAIRSLSYTELSEKFILDENHFYSIGFHPWHALEFSSEKMQEIKKLAKLGCVLAIGECGLDKLCNTTVEIQTNIFEQHIRLSESLQKPLIIHCVGYYNELLSMKNKFNPTQTWIIHGFRGKPQLATQLLQANISLSFGEYFNEDSLRLTPLDKIFIETDESKLQIEEIYRKLSLIKNCSIDKFTAGSLLFRKFENNL